MYDADGNKLQRMYIPESSAQTKVTVTSYIDQYLYQDTVHKNELTGKGAWQKPGGEVQYLNFEEGRIRVVEPVTQGSVYEALQIAGTMQMPNNKQGSFDYFIRDYQGNVRMILTDETHFSSGTATMELDRAGRGGAGVWSNRSRE